MAILSHSVSLGDADASRDELEALRDAMRSDSPYFDEPPVLDDFEPPDPADSLWWALETEPDHGAGYDRFLDSLAPDPDPDACCNDRGGFFGHAREEP